MLEKLLIKGAINKLANREQTKDAKKRRKEKKRRDKQSMVNVYGKARYYLSFWFGSWTLFTCNHRDYQNAAEEADYRKFYAKETVAKRYAERLKTRYEQVEITNVYDRHKREIGFLLTGKNKKVAEATRQPEKVIMLKNYRAIKAK